MIICQFCSEDFQGKKSRKFCSSSCFAKSRIDIVIAQNKARRKYEPIEGKTRHQIYWMNNHECREKHLARDRNKRFELLELLGGKCVRCGYNEDKRALVLDHIQSDGKKDRLRVGNRVYRYYVTRIEEAKIMLQVLCSNCNLIKSFESDEHNISRRVMKK